MSSFSGFEHSNPQLLTFRKVQDGRELHCEVQVFSDGSAYVTGDEIEIGFEESPEAYREAIVHLESLGYTRIVFE